MKGLHPHSDFCNGDISSYIVVGSLGKPYGIRGQIKVNSYTFPAKNIFNYSSWFLFRSEKWQKTDIVTKSCLGPHLVVKIQGIDSPEEAKELTHCQIGVEKNALPNLPQNQFYYSDLIGCSVINEDHFDFGIVDSVYPIGAQDMLVVQGKKTYQIPFKLDLFIKKVDITNKIIIVEWDPDF